MMSLLPQLSYRAVGRYCGRKHGFTLVELLVVLAIVAIMTSLAVGVFKSGNPLTVATNTTSEYIQLARSTAITDGTFARLYFITTATGPLAAQNYISTSIWRLQQQDAAGNTYTAIQPGAWVQETKWQKLPNGIIFDPGYTPVAADRVTYNIMNSSYSPNAYSALGDVSASDTPQLLGTPLQTPGVTYVTYLEFDNTGALSSISAGNSGLRLVEGFIDPSGTERLQHAPGGTPLNYSIIAIDNLTGRVRISRP